MEEDIEELLKRKDDYDFAYGTQIHRPYAMSEKDWELIENLLTRYKEIEALNKGHEEEIGRLEYCYEKALDDLTKTLKESIPKSKIKEKIEELIKEADYKSEDNPNSRVHFRLEPCDYQIQVLQELLQESDTNDL